MNLPSDISDLPEWLESLARQIAPDDLGEWPIYVGLASGLPPEFSGEMSGYTTTGWLWLALAESLGDRGPGPAMVLDDRMARIRIARRLPDVSLKRAQQLTITSLISTALHELSHVLEFDKPFRDAPAEEWRATAARCVRESLGEHNAREKKQTEHGEPTAPHLGDHGASFIRIALHLADRARRLGVQVGPFCAGSEYQLQDACFYESVLQSELRYLANASFAEIRATPIPECFLGMFEGDVRKREQRKELRTDWRAIPSPIAGQRASIGTGRQPFSANQSNAFAVVATCERE